ncbi:hypothetical protein AAHC03_05340 [Spirometra sp. Aus1]
MQASRDDNSGHSVEEDDADTPGLSSPSQVSAFDSLPTTPYVGTESTVGRGSPLACEQQPQAHLRAKPPLSPVAVHRSPSRKTVSGGRGAVNASTFPRTPCSTSLPTSRLGAVASLAVDGGLSEADLQKLGVGQDLRLYCATAPAGFSSSDGDIAEVRNCLEKRCYQWRSGTRFSRLPTDRAFHRISHHHHTAPPGTVSIHPNYLTVSDGGVGGVRSPPATSQETNPVSRTSQRYQRLYRRNRVTRCDICLSSPTSKNTSPGGGGESVTVWQPGQSPRALMSRAGQGNIQPRETFPPQKQIPYYDCLCFPMATWRPSHLLRQSLPVHSQPVQPSTCPPSLCKSVWCYPLSECAFSWSPLSSVVQESVAQSGLLGSSQLHPLGCSFSVPATDCLSCGYTCKIFFLQRENLNDIIQGLQRISASQGPTVSSSVEGRTQTMESSSTSSSSPSGLASLLTGKDVRGKNYGLAGPVGAFPLMVAAETLAASFGVHMNRSAQTISVRSPPTAKLTLSSQCGSTSVTIPKDAISARDLHESVASTTTESVPNVQNLAEQEKTTTGGGGKGRLLRSTFARMKQAAFSSSSSSSACSPNSTATSQSRTASSKFAPTATTKAFQQRRPFFSSSTTSCTLSSPEPLQQGSTQAHDWHHSFHATLETEAELLQQQEQQPDSWNQAQASPDQRDENGDLGQSNLPSSVLQPEAKGATVATTICIPLTATLEPTYSVLQSFSNEADPTPVSAHELPVTSPVQVAIVDSTLFTQSSSGPLVSESTTTTAETTEEEKANEAVLTASTISSTSASVSMTTSKTSTASKETVIGKTKQFLRRPNDSSYTAEANAEEPTETGGHQAKQSHRSQLGSLALHRCPRSTVSPFVPFIVELCVTLVERFGLNCVGIYRVSGNKVAHDFISSELTNKMDEIDTSSDKWNDINAVSCVLKTFLRNLPDSLIPKMMYSDFLAASRLESWERRLLSVQRLLGIMECYVGHPEYRAHRATLRYLATHLARVASRQSVNRMTPYNLALVFAPNLVQPSEDSPELFIADSKFKIWLVETIIKYHKWVFSPDLGLESGCFVPEDSDEIAEIEARSDSPTVDSSGTGAAPPAEEEEQPGRAEGDVRPILRELLSAAAQLPPPPSESDLESAEEPGPSIDRPAPVTVAAALLSRKGSSRVVDTSNRRQSSSSLPSTDRIGEGESECEASSLKGTPGSSMQTQLSPIERARLDRLSFLSADPTLPHLDPTTILKSSEQPSEKSPSTSLSPKGELQCFTSFSSLPPEPCLENLSGGPSTPRPSPQPLLFVKSAPSTPLPEDSLLDADVTATGKFLTLPVTGVGPSVTPPCGPRKKFASSGSHHGLHLFGGSERGRRLSLSSESMVFSLKPTAAAAAAAAATITTTTATVPLQAQEAAPTPSDENADLSSPAVKRSSLIRPRLIRLARIHTIGPTFSGRHAPKR